MTQKRSLSALLGLDLGRITTRASYLGIKQEKYRLQGFEAASTSLGFEMHLGTGAGRAMRQLQSRSDLAILNSEGRLLMPFNPAGEGVDRLAMVLSAGPWLRTSLMGLTSSGSLAAGRALVSSLPLTLSGVYGLADLGDQSAVIDDLISTRPELLILTGGEDAGAEKPLLQWCQTLRVLCKLLPEAEKPQILFAGNPLLESTVRRLIEPLTTLQVVPNLQPASGVWDLVPMQVALDRKIIQIWAEQVPGFADLFAMSRALNGTKSVMLDRMVRYLSHAKTSTSANPQKSGVLALDLGGGSTTIAAGVAGQFGTINDCLSSSYAPSALDDRLLERIQRWSAEPVTLEEVNQWLCNFSVYPSLVPETKIELALSQAFARVKIEDAIEELHAHYPWIPYHPEDGLVGYFEPIIASGAVLTHAPTPGDTMLMLLDGIQPHGITTIVLDKHHILPLLGVIAAEEPILPVQVLESDAFLNLGSVVVAVSEAPEGEPILQVDVSAQSGKDYSVAIVQGTLRRLVIPPDASAVLTLEPTSGTDIGLGGPGVGGRLKVFGGALGVVIDARGRPLRLPENDETRIEHQRRWLATLGV